MRLWRRFSLLSAILPLGILPARCQLLRPDQIVQQPGQVLQPGQVVTKPSQPAPPPSQPAPPPSQPAPPPNQPAPPSQDEATFSTEVKVVDILATVRTKSGQLVNDLAKDDFHVTENGRPQKIQYFSRESDLPLTIGLLIDTSISQEKVLDSERRASFQFVDQVLREGIDKVFVTQFDMAVLTRQPLTSSRQDLEQTLPYVATPSNHELDAQRGGGTLLFDAVVKASRDIMSTQSNRKAIIILSDGGENGSDETLESAIEAAQRSDTIIYSIYFSDPSFYGGFGDGGGEDILRQLAKETGGGFFAVSKKHDIGEIYATIEHELRSQYNLGFVSDQPVRVSEFRKLQLTVDRKGLVVQARDRYWAKR